MNKNDSRSRQINTSNGSRDNKVSIYEVLMFW
jgi:hypothetical protein